MVVNVNPLYTPRELEHQLKDSGAKAIVIIENFATTLQQVLAGGADQEGRPRARWATCSAFRRALIVNYVVRKREEDGAGLRAAGRRALQRRARQGRGKHASSRRRSAPTTSPCCSTPAAPPACSKGAVLLHRNLVANILQSEAWYQPALKKMPAGEQIVTICALPIYHIFGFNTNMMLSMRMGGCNILIPNPRDLPAVFKELRGEKLPQLPGGQHAVQRDGAPPRLRHASTGAAW